MKHMDEYTILYQAKNYITKERNITTLLKEKGSIDINDLIKNLDKNSEIIRELALEWLEQGVKAMKYEYPPNDSKRMEKYYNNNKQYLAHAFTYQVKEVINDYKELAN